MQTFRELFYESLNTKSFTKYNDMEIQARKNGDVVLKHFISLFPEEYVQYFLSSIKNSFVKIKVEDKEFKITFSNLSDIESTLKETNNFIKQNKTNILKIIKSIKPLDIDLVSKTLKIDKKYISRKTHGGSAYIEINSYEIFKDENSGINHLMKFELSKDWTKKYDLFYNELYTKTLKKLKDFDISKSISGSVIVKNNK